MQQNPIIMQYLTELDAVIQRAKLKWLDSDPIPKSLELLDSMSIALVLVKRFVAEDNLVAVQISWRDDIFGQLAFEKAFYKQTAIYAQARTLREKILKAIIARIKQ